MGAKEPKNQIWSPKMNNFLQCWIDINQQEEIEYFAHWGTLLSVYRGDLIPWECDQDFGMTVPNYEKWVKIWTNEENFKIKTENISSCQTFHFQNVKTHGYQSRMVQDVWLPIGDVACGHVEIEEWHFVKPNKKGIWIHEREFGQRENDLKIIYNETFPLIPCELKTPNRTFNIFCPREKVDLSLVAYLGDWGKPTYNQFVNGSWVFNQTLWDEKGYFLDYAMKFENLSKNNQHVNGSLVLSENNQYVNKSWILSENNQHVNGSWIFNQTFWGYVIPGMLDYAMEFENLSEKKHVAIILLLLLLLGVPILRLMKKILYWHGYEYVMVYKNNNV
jgi:hypothetical protein